MPTKKELQVRNDRQVTELNRLGAELETARRREAEQVTDIADLRMQLTSARALAERVAVAAFEVPKIRLEVLRQNSWADLEELERTLKWVLHGEITARPEPTPEDGGIKSDAPDDGAPTPPEIRRDSLMSAIADLRVAAHKLGELRADSNVSVGKVRIQNIDDRVRAVLADLTEIVEGRA